MATAQDLSKLFKVVYGKKLENLIPESSILSKRIPFKGAEKVGEKFVQPVMLSSEQGFTYNSDGSAFALNDAVTAVFKQAEVDGVELLLRTAISYRHASKAVEGPAAFASWTKLVVKNMVDSMAKRLEIGMLYGNAQTAGIGIVESVTDEATADTGTMTLSEASFAPGIWAGAEGSELEIYSVDGDGVADSLRNAASITVTSVDLDDRKITLAGTEAQLDAIAATDVIFFKGAKSNDMKGLHHIANVSGDLHGIDNSVYTLWKAHNEAISPAAPLTVSKVLEGVGKMVAKSGLNEDLILMVSPRCFEKVNATGAANARSFDSSYSSSKQEEGSRNITYYGQNGKIEIIPNIFCKNGDAFALSPKDFKRVGSTDVTFTLPGKPSEEIFLQLANNAGYELRCYSDQGIFTSSPSKLCHFSGITV